MPSDHKEAKKSYPDTQNDWKKKGNYNETVTKQMSRKLEAKQYKTAKKDAQ